MTIYTSLYVSMDLQSMHNHVEGYTLTPNGTGGGADYVADSCGHFRHHHPFNLLPRRRRERPCTELRVEQKRVRCAGQRHQARHRMHVSIGVAAQSMAFIRLESTFHLHIVKSEICPP